VYAVKVVTHEKYSFYNPKQHPIFDRDGGREIYFEGTYTHTFSGNNDATPRYDYNQVMYKLDLADPRAALPVAMYRTPEGVLVSQDGLPKQGAAPVEFCALDRPGGGSIAVYEGVDHASQQAKAGTPTVDRAAFFALPADMANPPATTTPLYEFVHADGRRRHTTDADWSSAGFKRAEQPLCRVWKNPLRVALPR
jgi:hypothetical protein